MAKVPYLDFFNYFNNNLGYEISPYPNSSYVAHSIKNIHSGNVSSLCSWIPPDFEMLAPKNFVNYNVSLTFGLAQGNIEILEQDVGIAEFLIDVGDNFIIEQGVPSMLYIFNSESFGKQHRFCNQYKK